MRLPGSAGRSGGRRATPEGVVSMPPMLRPRAGTRDAATGRGLGISAPRAGTKDSRHGRGRELFASCACGNGWPHQNRGISAEMQCGTAPRAARDLTGEPCSPVNPFFLDGGFWLGESASRKPGGGVGGAFYASGGAEVFVTPDDFSLVPPGGTVSFYKKEMVGPTVLPPGGRNLPSCGPRPQMDRAALCAESFASRRENC